MALTLDEDVLDTALAQRALRLAAPTIELLLDQPGVSGERVLHVIVLNPAVTPANGRFEDALLAESAFGAPKPWGADYRQFARDKAHLAWRWQRDSRDLVERAPHLLRAGDTRLWGSHVENGLIVAASGAHPWYDTAACRIVCALIVGLCAGRMTGQ